MIDNEETRVVKIEVDLDTKKARRKAKSLEKDLMNMQKLRGLPSGGAVGVSDDGGVQLKSPLQQRREMVERLSRMQAKITERIPNSINAFSQALQTRKTVMDRRINSASAVITEASTAYFDSVASSLRSRIKEQRYLPVQYNRNLPTVYNKERNLPVVYNKERNLPVVYNPMQQLKSLLGNLDGGGIGGIGGIGGGGTGISGKPFFERMQSVWGSFLKVNRVIALTLGTFMMLNAAIGSVIQTFDELNKQMADVDKNMRLTQASRESFKQPEYLDQAIRRISDLSGMTRGQAGAQLGTIYSEFKASGQNIREQDITKIAELAFAYANTSTADVSMDKAFERIQGLVTGRTSAAESGLYGYKKGSTLEQSLGNIEKLLKDRSTYESVMQGGTYASVTARGANVLTNTFERMYEKAPIQLRNNAVSTTLYKEELFGSRNPEGQSAFIKAFNSIGAIMDKLTTLTSPNKTLSLFIETAMRTLDLLAELWIGIEPFVNVLLSLVNKIISVLQPAVAIVTRTTNLIGTMVGLLSGTVDQNKMTEVWNQYKTFLANGINGNPEGKPVEGAPVTPTPLPPSDQNKPSDGKKQKVSYVNDMGVTVETVITVNSKGKLDNDTKVVD